MLEKKQRESVEVNASSMADIAFLLLIFFLVTTTIASDKGLSIRLPPKNEDQLDIEIRERNIFNVLVNSNNQLLVEEQPMNVKDLRQAAKDFIMNNGADETSSESPEKAIISLKTDRGTDYKVYIIVMDELKRAYNELRAQHMGITLEEYIAIQNDEKLRKDNEKLKEAKAAIPYQLSEAEPTNVN